MSRYIDADAIRITADETFSDADGSLLVRLEDVKRAITQAETVRLTNAEKLAKELQNNLSLFAQILFIGIGCEKCPCKTICHKDGRCRMDLKNWLEQEVDKYAEVHY